VRAADRPVQGTSEPPEPWPATGGCLKLLLASAIATRQFPSAALAEIEQSTGASLSLGFETAEDWPGHQALAVRGATGAEMREAFQRVLTEVATCDSTREAATQRPLRVKVLLPRWLASVVIGYRGANVKEIRRVTSTSLHVEQSEHKNATEQVANVGGQVSNILDCFARILTFKQDRKDDEGDDARDEGNEQPDVSAKDSDDADSVRRASRPPAPPAPPAPWKMEEHPDAPGEYYYLNTETGETTWEVPQAPAAASRAKDTKDTKDVKDAKDTKAAKGKKSAPSSKERPIAPAPWTTLEHPEAPGEYYYLNEETGETCWELPESKPPIVRAVKRDPKKDRAKVDAADRAGSSKAVAKAEVDVDGLIQAAAAAARGENRQEATTSADGGAPPYPWITVEHPEGGYYYQNEQTGDTTWELPGADEQADSEVHPSVGDSTKARPQVARSKVVQKSVHKGGSSPQRRRI